MRSHMITAIAFGLVWLLSVIIFDVTMFAYLPSDYVSGFKQYRFSPPPDTVGRRAYPIEYFVEHKERGFDIGKNKHGDHWVESITYPIWSNSLGCFDNEHTDYNEYVYFAGDSMAWGFAPFEQKFGTVIQETTGTNIFNCGVTHTGQRHQFDKLVEIVEKVRKAPIAIFVFYSWNDVANDYAHPHTSVIRGWQFDTASLSKDYELIRYELEELYQRFEDALDRFESREDEKAQSGWPKQAKRTLKFYSLSINILDHLKDSIKKMGAVSAAPDEIDSTRNIYELPIENDGRHWYSDNPYSNENKAALLNFRKFSAENDAELVVVLIPPQQSVIDTNWYRELGDFLTENGIRYIALSSNFREQELTSKELYWTRDPHFNPSGNKIVAEILISEFPLIFQRQHSTN